MVCDIEFVPSFEGTTFLLLAVLVVLIECKDVDDDEVAKPCLGMLAGGSGGDRPCREVLEYLRVREEDRGKGFWSTGDVLDWLAWEVFRSWGIGGSCGTGGGCIEAGESGRVLYSC